MPAVVEAIATGTPGLTRSQQFAASFMSKIESLPHGIRERLPDLYARSAIDFRHTCVDDYDRDAPDFEFFPTTWSLQPAPSTSERNRRYREAAVPLAVQVATDALERAGRARESVTHVICVSCTGLFAPGLDIVLTKELGLRPTTQRLFVGFMGCYAAFNAMRAARAFCEQPGACVLIVCVELCTLHFQISDSMEDAVINGIFSDGAGAMVMAHADEDSARGKIEYMDQHCLLDDDSLDCMTWDIGDTGFQMGLSPRVPVVLSRQLPVVIDGLLGRHGLHRDNVSHWAIHPGGRAILDRAQVALGLSDAQLHDSREVLRLNGNMSSPTILFILERIFRRHEDNRSQEKGEIATIFAMAFGPGLTLETALFRGR